MKNNKGFSLVELIVVIAIMAILAAVAIPTFATFIKKANVAADEDFANGVKYAVNLALAGEGKEAASITVTMDSDGQGIDKLTYTLKDDTTVYVAMGEAANTETAASDKIKEMITTTIDQGYKLKTASVTTVAGISITKAEN